MKAQNVFPDLDKGMANNIISVVGPDWRQLGYVSIPFCVFGKVKTLTDIVFCTL